MFKRPLVLMLNEYGFHVCLETNGTIAIDESIFHAISFSPKGKLSTIRLKTCTSLKILYPYYNGATAEEFKKFPCEYRCIQPIDYHNESINSNCVEAAVDEVLQLRKGWKLGLQIHKYIKMR